MAVAGGSATSLHGKKYHDTYNANAARCNYVHTKAAHHFANSTSLSTTLALSADTSPFDNLISLIQAQVSELQAKTQQMQDFLNVKTSDPKQFFDLVILEFLEAAEIVVLFVLDVVEDILIALLDLIGGPNGALSTLQTTLNKWIEIPIITWLWKHVITDDDPFSILDLVCLIMALPGTILYKLLFAASDPKNKPFTSDQVASVLGKDIPWPSFGTAASPDRVNDIDADDDSSIYVILFALGGISYFLYTVVDVSIDIMASVSEDEEDPLATFLSWSGIVISCAILGLTAPYKIFGKDGWSEADKATVALWAVSFAPTLLNTGFTAFSTAKAETRFTKLAGPIALSIFGGGRAGHGHLDDGGTGTRQRLPGRLDRSRQYHRPDPSNVRLALATKRTNGRGFGRVPGGIGDDLRLRRHGHHHRQRRLKSLAPEDEIRGQVVYLCISGKQRHSEHDEMTFALQSLRMRPFLEDLQPMVSFPSDFAGFTSGTDRHSCPTTGSFRER